MRYMRYIRFVVVLYILVLTIIFFLGSKSAHKSEKYVYQEDYKRTKSLYQIIKYWELSTEEVQRVYMETNQSQLDYSKNREPTEEVKRVYMGTNHSQLDYSKNREPTEEVKRVYMGTNHSQLDYSKNREPTEEVKRVYMGTNHSQLDYSKNREPTEEVKRVYMGTNQQLDYNKSREPTEEVQRVYMGTNQSQLDYNKNREPTEEVRRIYMGTNQSQLDYSKNREPTEKVRRVYMGTNQSQLDHNKNREPTEEVRRIYMGTNQSQLDYGKNREPTEEVRRIYMGTNQSQLDYGKNREPTEEVRRIYMGTNQSQLDYGKNREPTEEVRRIYMGTNQSQLDYGKNREPYITFLLEGQARFCGDRFIVYKNLFSKLVNVIVDPSFGKGRKGGENLTQVMNQPEEEEFYQLEKGFFQMSCSDTVKYQFGEKSHLHKWLHSLDTLVKQKNDDVYEIPDWTIAVQRYEYVNIYHTMTDWYNVFIVSKVFKINPNDITVLFIDGHPRGGLDSTWEQMLRNVRIGHINKPVLYKNLIWGIAGYKSPLYEHELPEVAFIEDFREFFLSSHGVQLDEQINCDKLNVVIIWRHDYVAHARNPSGSVSRKMKNENELLNKISDLFQGHNVHGLQIDKLPMKQQLEITSKTDILIGMHGAGLTHALFLPKHSGLIELFPIYLSDANIHFRAMSKWRHLYYLSWSNSDHTRELDNNYTVVDADHIVKLAREMRNMICENKMEVITQ